MVVGHTAMLVGCSFDKVIVVMEGRCKSVVQLEDVV